MITKTGVEVHHPWREFMRALVLTPRQQVQRRSAGGSV
jgi:hypothetical protein